MHYPRAFYELFFRDNTLYQTRDSSTEASVQQPIGLVAEPEENTPKPRATEVATTFPALRFEVGVAVSYSEAEQLPPNQAALLDKILQAIGYSLSQVEVINVAKLAVSERDARRVIAEQKLTHLILFGVQPIELHLDVFLTPYRPKQLDRTQLLKAEPLALIEQDREAKRKLWEALKQLFGR